MLEAYKQVLKVPSVGVEMAMHIMMRIGPMDYNILFRKFDFK